MKKRLAKELDADNETVDKWQTVVDVLDHIDTVELAKKYPNVAATAVKIAATIVGICVVPAAPVACLILALPKSVATKIMEFSGVATSEHIINIIAKRQVSNNKQKSIETEDITLETDIEK